MEETLSLSLLLYRREKSKEESGEERG